jgi:hypothetical protein
MASTPKLWARENAAALGSVGPQKTKALYFLALVDGIVI